MNENEQTLTNMNKQKHKLSIIHNQLHRNQPKTLLILLNHYINHFQDK